MIFSLSTPENFSEPQVPQKSFPEHPHLGPLLTPSSPEYQSSSGTIPQSLLELCYCCADLQLFLLAGPWTCVAALSPTSGFNSCISWLFLLFPRPCSVCHIQMLLVCASPAVQSLHPFSHSKYTLTAAT